MVSGVMMPYLLVGPENFNILQGHSRATMFLICNNAAQGILSSFFFKYAGKCSSFQSFFRLNGIFVFSMFFYYS
jgi:hypothetical protein